MRFMDIRSYSFYENVFGEKERINRYDYGMAKSKFETHIKPNIEFIEEMVSSGVTYKDIAKALHIDKSSLWNYLQRGEAGEEPYVELFNAFARGNKLCNKVIEDALYKRAHGYQWVETMTETITDPHGNVTNKERKILRDVPPDPTSMMFWLTNRSKDWHYRSEKGSTDDKEGGVVMIPEVKE